MATRGELRASVAEEAAKVMKRGEAILASLQRGRYGPAKLALERIIIRAVHTGKLDEVDKDGRRAFCRNIYDYAVAQDPGLMEDIESSGELSIEGGRALDAIVDGYLGGAGPAAPATGDAQE